MRAQVSHTLDEAIRSRVQPALGEPSVNLAPPRGEAVLALQRRVGNRATAAALADRDSSSGRATARQLTRCQGRCTCGGACGRASAEDELVDGFMKRLQRAVAERNAGSRAASRTLLQRDPAVCDPTVASCPAGTIAPDGTLNTGIDQVPMSGTAASQAATASGGSRTSGGRRTPATCDPAVASCPAGTVGPDGTPNVGKDAAAQPAAALCDPSISSCAPGTVAPDGTRNTGGERLPDGALVPRPPGIPLDQGVQLIPLQGLPAGFADQLPEGQMLTVPAAAAVAQPGGGAGGFWVPRSLESGGAASGGAILAGNYQVMNYGFAAAGDNSFGLVAIPRIQPLFKGGAINPQANPLIDLARPADAWGHTAMFVRRGGRIEWVRGFNPDMSPGQLPGFLRTARAIEAGEDVWPGVVESDTSMLRSTMAKTVEYPISPELAEQIARGHPVGPGGTGGSPLNYTARPATYAQLQGDPLLVCTNTNCVGYAVRAGEAHLGGPIGPRGGGSIVDVGSRGASVPNTAGQGQLYGMLANAEEGGVRLSIPPQATGSAVVGSMPRALRYVKWGGRVFLVVGIVAGGIEIYNAPKGQHVRTAVGVAGGFAGGFALGATAGLICGPGAVVCSVVLGLGLGIAGSLAGRSLAESVYDASNVPATTYTDEINRQAHGGVVCPNCHRALQPNWMLGPGSPSTDILGAVNSSTPGGPSGLRRQTLSDDDLRVLQQWLNAGPAR